MPRLGGLCEPANIEPLNRRPEVPARLARRLLGRGAVYKQHDRGILGHEVEHGYVSARYGDA